MLDLALITAILSSICSVLANLKLLPKSSDRRIAVAILMATTVGVYMVRDKPASPSQESQPSNTETTGKLLPNLGGQWL